MPKEKPYSNEHELIQVGKASKLQLEILRIMDEQGEELVWEKGAGWWIGLGQTSGRTVKQLIQFTCIKLTKDSNMGDFQRWEINSTGQKTLETGYFYTHPLMRKVSDAKFKVMVEQIEEAYSDVVWIKILKCSKYLVGDKKLEGYYWYKDFVGQYAQVLDNEDRWAVLKNGFASPYAPNIMKDDAIVVTEQEIQKLGNQKLLKEIKQ